MKICIIGPQYPWQGGIAKYLDSLGRELNKNYKELQAEKEELIAKFNKQREDL